MIRIGCAGWDLRSGSGDFTGDTPPLARYAKTFRAVEIDSSFHRAHPRETYASWAEAVPRGFRFAVKLPKLITHRRALHRFEEPLDAFLEQVDGLGEKLGALLVQLPPTLVHDGVGANAFFKHLRARYEGALVVEPRHPSWFTREVDQLLMLHRVARAGVDPTPVMLAAEPGGWGGVVYYRLHGSPRMYHTLYDSAFLAAMAERIHRHLEQGAIVWCVFDNTARQAALSNALEMLRLLETDPLAQLAA